MLAFQRRFDEPLLYAKQLVESGAIGRVFKIYSALEDSNPAPNGYHSGGILPDMAVHNVDEISMVVRSHAFEGDGDRVANLQPRANDGVEDFDDASLYFWFETDLMAQIQVSRNHVSGYRVETVLFGEHGQVQVGHFEQRPFEITVRAFGKRGRPNVLADRTFTMRNYGRPLPEFIRPLRASL